MHALPEEIISALDKGFVLSHAHILGSLYNPKADQLHVRGLCLALEAAFSAIIWCMTFCTIIVCSWTDWSLDSFGAFH